MAVRRNAQESVNLKIRILEVLNFDLSPRLVKCKKVYPSLEYAYGGMSLKSDEVKACYGALDDIKDRKNSLFSKDLVDLYIAGIKTNRSVYFVSEGNQEKAYINAGFKIDVLRFCLKDQRLAKVDLKTVLMSYFEITGNEKISTDSQEYRGVRLIIENLGDAQDWKNHLFKVLNSMAAPAKILPDFSTLQCCS